MFQRADLNNGFGPAKRHQRFRQVKVFEVNYLREGADYLRYCLLFHGFDEAFLRVAPTRLTGG
ncbi:hypothetical protein [Tabrizicola soli]|uniref:Uncharacterized protein n=1 Tax=Tabrizicola soli TaxID=2185115 RepID=A0ABV7DT10_9RHOB